MDVSIAPDVDCPKCGGSPGLMSSGDGRKIKCICILVQEAKQYLTPVYANAKYIKSFKAQELIGKNMLIDSVPQMAFKAVIKSFLLNTGMRYSHITATAYDILQAYLTDTEHRLFKSMAEVQYLIIFLVADPRNRSYGDIIVSLLEKRANYGLTTILYSSKHVGHCDFRAAYSDKLTKFLEDHFTRLSGVVKLVDENAA